ncbi:MAG TPA: hypothetical protein VIC34_06995 [Croceibacterium sp.]|jgi:hypothetical protein
MRKFLLPFLAGALLAGGGVTAPAAAQKHSDQESARNDARAGRVLSLGQLERMVVPQIERMGRDVQYLTPEWDPAARAYRLKFIDNSNGQVIWVDVDARTGHIIRISK